MASSIGITSSSELWVLNKIIELHDRLGLDPISSEICFEYVREPGPLGDVYYEMGGVFDGIDPLSDEGKKVEKLRSLLGLDELDGRRFNNLQEVKDVIDRALSLAPRARSRS